MKILFLAKKIILAAKNLSKRSLGFLESCIFITFSYFGILCEHFENLKKKSTESGKTFNRILVSEYLYPVRVNTTIENGNRKLNLISF